MENLKTYSKYIGFIILGGLIGNGFGQGCITINKYPIEKRIENIIGSEEKEVYYEILNSQNKSKCYVEIDGIEVDALNSFLKKYHYSYDKEDFIKK